MVGRGPDALTSSTCRYGHAQYTRLWNDEEPTLATERERLAKLALEKEKEKEKEDEGGDGMDVDATKAMITGQPAEWSPTSAPACSGRV